jgi:hypothetical protein
MEGLPVVVALVGAPSSGKTIMLDAVSKLDEVHPVDTFTEAGLLSASSDGTQGLLTRMGPYGILLFPDFTVLMSKGSEERSQSFGLLRRIVDGALIRNIGTKGGTLCWEGKCGGLIAATQAVFMESLGVMGERIIYYPMPKASHADRVLAGYSVLDNLGHQDELRARRIQIVSAFFAGLKLPKQPPPFSQVENDRLIVLADLGSRSRSPVIRDRQKSDGVEMVPDPEHLPRLLGALGQLAAGMRAIGVPEPELWRLVGQCAVGGVHPTRRRIIEILVESREPRATALIAGRCRLPQTTVRRFLA